MASSAQYVFATLLIIQAILLILYIAIKESSMANPTVRATSIVSFDTVNKTVTHYGWDSNFLVNTSVQKIIQKMSRKTFTEIVNKSTTEIVNKSTTEIVNKSTTEIVNKSTTEIVNKSTIVENPGQKRENIEDRVRGFNLPVRSDLQKQITGATASEGSSMRGMRIPERFQPIDEKEAWLYSAFFDHVAALDGRPLVRIFGVVKINYVMKVYCQFKPHFKGFSSTGAILAFPDQHKTPYRTIYLECPLPSNAHPTHVSVSFETTDKPTNRLQILYPGPRIRNFTVCYSVLHSGYNKPTQLIESIEMNRILGAEHFMVYNYSISPAVDQILRRYQEDGLVTVLQWQIPTLGSWYFAQMTSLNDCSYRNRNTSRFVVVVDTDELIVPRSNYTWMELINSASPQETDVSQFINPLKHANMKQHLTGSFIVPSITFTTDTIPNWTSLSSMVHFNENETKNIIKYKILALSQFWRAQLTYPHRSRSKYISRPELVYISGIHYVAKFTCNVTSLNVNESQARLHHYKLPQITKWLVIDTTMLKFKQVLYKGVMKQIERFPKIFT